MKITAIETHVCNARMRNWVFVKVLTDQPGLYGWGEATLEWHTRGVVGAIEDLAQLLVGEDPTRIEHLWQMMYRQHFWHGNGVVRATAISGIDIALWDIMGKWLDVPCHKLWGGPVRDYVRLYCHLGGGKMEDFYETSPPTRSASPSWRSRRWKRASPRSRPWPCRRRCHSKACAPVRHAEQCVAAMREAVGDAHRHHGRLPRAPFAGDGPAVRQGAGAVRPVLVRRALLAGADGRHRRGPARRDHADRHGRTADQSACVPRAVGKGAAAACFSPTSPTAAA